MDLMYTCTCHRVEWVGLSWRVVTIGLIRLCGVQNQVQWARKLVRHAWKLDRRYRSDLTLESRRSDERWKTCHGLCKVTRVFGEFHKFDIWCPSMKGMESQFQTNHCILAGCRVAGTWLQGRTLWRSGKPSLSQQYRFCSFLAVEQGPRQNGNKDDIFALSYHIIPDKYRRTRWGMNQIRVFPFLNLGGLGWCR